MKPYRVLIAHCRYKQRGGEDSVAEAEMELLQQNGHEVSLLTRNNEEIDTLGKGTVVLQTLWSKRTQVDVAKAVETFRPDIIHVHNTFPLLSPSLYWAAAKANIPIVQTLHNFRLLCAQAMLLRDGQVCEECVGGLPWRGIVNKCYRDSAAQSAVLVSTIALHRTLGTYKNKVTRYIALNDFCRDKFIQGGLPAHKLVIKPNFVSIPFAESQPRQGGLFVGRLSSEKGIDVLISAVAKLPGYEINLIGTGPEQAKLEQQPNIHLLGWQEQPAIHTHMRQASYLVMPSIWYENFPRTLVEAFACGLPVIASRLGAMAELVEDGITGLLFEPNSATDLAQKLAWAKSHPEKMAKMGHNARLKYEMNYTPEKNYQQLIDIYSEAIHSAQNEKAA